MLHTEGRGSHLAANDDERVKMTDEPDDHSRDVRRLRGYAADAALLRAEGASVSPIREGQKRLFTRRDRARLKLILRGKRFGFSLEEIRQLLDLYDTATGSSRS
jgi:hypothetical protein